MNSPEIKFRLNEFKQIAAWLDKKLPPPLAFVLKGWLWGLEEKYIAAKASASVSKAIREYKDLMIKEEGERPLLDPPSYHSEPSEVEGLDVIEIKAPYYERK